MPIKQKANEAENNQSNAHPKKGTHKKKKGIHKAKQTLVKAKQKTVNKKHKYVFGSPSDLAFADRPHWQTSSSQKNTPSKDNDQASRRELYLRLNQRFKVEKGNSPALSKDVKDEKNMWAKIKASQKNAQIIQQENNLPPHNDNPLAPPTNEQKEDISDTDFLPIIEEKELKEIKEDIPDTDSLPIIEEKEIKEDISDTDSLPIIEEKELKEEKSDIGPSQITAQDKADFMSLVSKIEQNYGTSYDQIPTQKLYQLILLQGYDENYLDWLYSTDPRNTGKITKEPQKEANDINDDAMMQFVQFISLLESTYRVSYDQIPPQELKKLIIKEGFDPSYLKYLAMSKGNAKQKQSKKYTPQYTDDEIKGIRKDKQDLNNFKKFAKSLQNHKVFKGKDLKEQMDDMYHFDGNLPPLALSDAASSLDDYPETKENIGPNIPDTQEIKEVKMKDKEQPKEEYNHTALPALDMQPSLQWLEMNLLDDPSPELMPPIANVIAVNHHFGNDAKQIVAKKATKHNFYKLILDHWNSPEKLPKIGDLATHLFTMDNNALADLPTIKALILKLGIDPKTLNNYVKNADDNLNFIQLMISLDPTNDDWHDAFYDFMNNNILGDGSAQAHLGMSNELVFVGLGVENEISSSESEQNNARVALNLDFIKQENFQDILLKEAYNTYSTEQFQFAQLYKKVFKDSKTAQSLLDKKEELEIDDDDIKKMDDYLKKGVVIADKQEAIETNSLDTKQLLGTPVNKIQDMLEPFVQAHGKGWEKRLATHPVYQAFFKKLYQVSNESDEIILAMADNILVKEIFLDKEWFILFKQADKHRLHNTPSAYKPETHSISSIKKIQIKNKKSFKNLLQVFIDLKYSKTGMTPHAAYDLDSGEFEFDSNLVANFNKYLAKITSEYNKSQFLLGTSQVKFRQLTKKKSNPSSYFDSILKGKIQNFFVFDYEALEQLIINYKQGNNTKPPKPLCLILHTDVNSSAFMQDPYLTKVITNKKLFTLVLEGQPNLEAYGALIPKIAEKYGVNGKIDQLMIAGHGFKKEIQLTQAKEFKNHKPALDQLLDVVFKHMDQKNAPAKDKQPNRRILLNACHTGEPTLATKEELEKLNPQEQKAFLKKFYEDNADNLNLQEYIENYAKKKGADIKHVIGANMATNFDKLIEEDTGKLTLADKFMNNKALKTDKKDILEYTIKHNYNPHHFASYLMEAYYRKDTDWQVIQSIIQSRVKNANHVAGQQEQVRSKNDLKYGFLDKGKFDKSLHILLKKPFKLLYVYDFIKELGWPITEFVEGGLRFESTEWFKEVPQK